MARPIQLRRALTATSVPTNLLAGEPAVTVTGAPTKMWLGDGTAPGRLVLSTDPATDNPLFTAAYARTGGATFTGTLTLDGTVQTGANDAATRQFVLDQVASMQLFMDTWNATTNVPDLNAAITGPPPLTAGAYFIVSTGATAPVMTGHAIPGLTTAVNPGDMIIWRGAAFEAISGGGMTQAEGDLRYLQLVAGGTVSGVTQFSATLNAGSPADQAATKGYIDTAISGTIQEPATAGNWLRVSPAGWAQGLPLAGGAISGGLTVGTTLGVTGALTAASGSFTAPLGFASGGTNAATAPLALDQLAGGVVNPATGALVRSVAGVWSLSTALGIPEPATAGNWLRQANGTNDWVAGLPLTGGTMDAVTGAAGGGTGITIANTGAGYEGAITVTTSGVDSYGIHVQNAATGGSIGLSVENSGQRGIDIDNRPAATGPGLTAVSFSNSHPAARFASSGAGSFGAVTVENPSASGFGIYVNDTGNGGGGGIDVNSTFTGAARNRFRVRNAGANYLLIDGNGVVNIGTPTGGTPPTTPGNINISGGIFVNGVPFSAGIPEPATAGNWLRNVNGTNTWVEGLPLTGGTLTGLLTVGTPTGPAVTGSSVNVAGGFYVNGVDIDTMVVNGGTF